MFIWPFLDHAQDSHYYNTVVVLTDPIFSISFRRCLYLLILIFSLTDMLLSVHSDISNRIYVFLLYFLDTIYCPIYFPVRLYCNVSEKSRSFGFCNLFWLVFIPFFRFRWALVLCRHYFPLPLYLQPNIFWLSISCYYIDIGFSISLYVSSVLSFLFPDVF